MSDIVTIMSSMGGRVPGMGGGVSGFLTNAAQGSTITTLQDPFAGTGLGTTVFSTVGSVPQQLALSGSNIVVGTNMPDRTTHYNITIQAVSGDGKQTVSETLRFRAGISNAPPAITPPALPLPAGAHLMGHGDSILGLGLTNSNATNSISTRMESILEAAWARNPNFNYENWYDQNNLSPWNATTPWQGDNQGIPGDHMDWASAAFGNGILPRAAYTLARNPDIIYLQGGGNSINSGDATGADGAGGYDPSTGITTYASAAYVIRKLDATINVFTNAGKWVILQTILPDGFWPSGDVRHQTIRDVNVWIRQQAGRTGVKILDPYNAFLSADPDMPNLAYTQEQTNLSANPPVYGGIHPNQAGAWLIVRDYLGPLLDTMIAPGSVLDQSPANSNLVASNIALMQAGTAGGLSAGGTTGGTTPVAPTGQSPSFWGVNSLRGASTSTVSIDSATSAAYSRLVLNVTPVNDAYTGAFHEIDISPVTQTFATAVPAGSWVQAWIHIETPTTGVLGDGPSNLYGNWSVQNAAGNVLALNRAQLEFTGLNAFPNFGRGNYWLKFPPILVPANGPATKSTMTLSVLFPKTNPAFTVKVDRFIIRQIPDPRPARNLP